MLIVSQKCLISDAYCWGLPLKFVFAHKYLTMKSIRVVRKNFVILRHEFFGVLVNLPQYLISLIVYSILTLF